MTGAVNKKDSLNNDTCEMEVKERKCNFVQDDEQKETRWEIDHAFFVFKQCLISRILLFILQVVFNEFVLDWPTDAFKGIEPLTEELTKADHWVRTLFSGFARWDAAHFLHIAHYGYTFENTLAFFPFFPSLIHYMTLVWCWAAPFLHFTTALMLSAVALNFIAFMLCGQLLYLLLVTITKSVKVSLLGCLVFSLNPASIFFSAIYSESIYMLFTLSGMLALCLDPTLPFFRHLVAALLFSFAFATRSNGILNFGYIVYHLLTETFYSHVLRKYIWQRDLGTVLLKFGRLFAVLSVCWAVFSSQVVSHETRVRHQFCKTIGSNDTTAYLPEVVTNYAAEHGLVLPTDNTSLSWCRRNRTYFNPLPVFYKHIQAKYWDVKPFGYWQYSKLPCFLMAAPALYIAAYGSIMEFLRLYRLHGSINEMLLGVFRDSYSTVPFVIHSILLSTLALVFYNVEVVTRILFSSTPFMYIALARYMDSRTPLVTLHDVQYPTLLPFFTNFHRTSFIHTLLLLYLLGYFYIGTLLHINWLPFT